ncbi:MAG: hypothetical protein WBA74_23420, partial [Cyclobacteriaceae bacterium]
YKATSEKPLTNFYFVGIKEFFVDDLNILKENLNWPDFQFSSKQTNQYPKYQENVKQILTEEKIVKKLENLNILDIELYRAALSLRKNKLKSKKSKNY